MGSRQGRGRRSPANGFEIGPSEASRFGPVFRVKPGAGIEPIAPGGRLRDLERCRGFGKCKAAQLMLRLICPNEFFGLAHQDLNAEPIIPLLIKVPGFWYALVHSVQGFSELSAAFVRLAKL
jgi:hypothetical protein